MKNSVPFICAGLLLSACSAGTGDRLGQNDADPAGGGAAGAPGGNDDVVPDPGPFVLDSLDDVTRVARLSHSQYRNTVSDLLGVEDHSASRFAPDALNGFAFDTSIDLRVDARLGPQYRIAAEEIAQRAVAEQPIFDRIVPCSPSDGNCSAQFISSFGERAFRRPLTPTETARFETLFGAGPELVGSGDAFRDGVQLVVEAALQSPQFLYRSELATAADADGNIALTSWEVASKLSYLIYDSMPDTELFDLARNNELTTPEQVQAAAARLLESERALPKLTSFHEQAWDFGRFSRISPDQEVYPSAPADLGDRVGPASRAFVREVIENGGGLSEFLTAPYAYADGPLAALYGVESGDELSRIELDPNVRQGLLMQVGFLASHAYSIKTDPIHRGLFVQRNLLCADIPDPPPGASTMEPPAATEPIETTRQEVELLTGQTGCVNCHLLINPPGFAFESFDAVGQVRTEEGGVVVDTSGQITLDGAMQSFEDALGLVNAVADSADARACYAEHWLKFAYGRKLLPEDEPTTLTLASADLSVRDIVKNLTSSPNFLNRKANEVSP